MANTRVQHTIGRPFEQSGFGMFTGADATLRFLPADEDTGIVFRRVDLNDQPEVAATIDNIAPSHRRTVIQDAEARVEMTEHVMAALAGLEVDNCIVEINAPEVPGFDGSCRETCDGIMQVGIVDQTKHVTPVVLRSIFDCRSEDGLSEIQGRPHVRPIETVTYQLDYGHRSPVPPQSLTIELTPDVFLRDIAFARTFVLESEVESLKAAGYGQRMTPRDLVVFRDDGSVIENQLRADTECVRHKILDCVGDFALLGKPIRGHMVAWRSGHNLNHSFVKEIQTVLQECDRPASAA